jgi:hypothetical protein
VLDVGLLLLCAAGWLCALWQYLRAMVIEDRGRAVSRALIECETRPLCVCGKPRK